MTDLVQFNSEVSIAAIDNKQGKGARLLKAAEFKAQYKLSFPDSTRKEQKAAFAAYYKKGINANVEKLAAALATGNYGVEQATTKGAKTKIVLVDKTKLDEISSTDTRTLDSIVDTMEADQLRQLIERLTNKLALPVENTGS